MSRPSTDITLPSLGIPYGDKAPGGVVHIRPMLTADEKLLAVSNPSQETQIRMIDNLLAATVKLPGGLTPEDLLTTDRLYLFIQLRIVSYGKDYPIVLLCPSCKAQTPLVLDLEKDLPIKWADTESAPVAEATLDNGDLVRFHQLTAREHKRVLNEVKRVQKAAPQMKGDPTETVLLAVRLDSVECSSEPSLSFDAEDQNKFLKAKAYVEQSLASVAWEIRDALDEQSSGYTMKLIETLCPKCGTAFEMEFTPSGDFFRPMRKNARTDHAGATVSSEKW